MLGSELAGWVAIVLVCLGSAGAATLWLMPASQKGRSGALRLNRDMVFLFEGTEMFDATQAGRDILGDAEDQTTWDTFRQSLIVNFPGFPADPETVRKKGRIQIPALDTKLAKDAICEWVDGIIRVELRTDVPHTKAALPPEYVRQRVAMDSAPYPVWHVGLGGQVEWCNTAYAALANRIREDGANNNEPLFSLSVELEGKEHRVRTSVDDPKQNKKLWYDLIVVDQEDGRLCYAVDINAVVDAEVAQRNFVQTLAKTFAQLSIGLAIFDRNRQLALFNPALVDLTSLPADFLSGRPTLQTFFDRLRDKSMMPEPKDYGSWRDRMTELVEAASVGNYQETWTLPSGSVYSVSGRPHPDRAVAFLFEDITAEITLTRRFRSELELGQSVMDALEDAIVVFSPDGTLAFSNAAYNQMWDVDPDGSFAQITVVDATRGWQARSTATPLWGEIRDFVDSREDRVEWWGDAQLRNGEILVCQVHPIPSGATMVSFREKQTIRDHESTSAAHLEKRA